MNEIGRKVDLGNDSPARPRFPLKPENCWDSPEEPPDSNQNADDALDVVTIDGSGAVSQHALQRTISPQAFFQGLKARSIAQKFKFTLSSLPPTETNFIHEPEGESVGPSPTHIRDRIYEGHVGAANGGIRNLSCKGHARNESRVARKEFQGEDSEDEDEVAEWISVLSLEARAEEDDEGIDDGKGEGDGDHSDVELHGPLPRRPPRREEREEELDGEERDREEGKRLFGNTALNELEPTQPIRCSRPNFRREEK